MAVQAVQPVQGAQVALPADGLKVLAGQASHKLPLIWKPAAQVRQLPVDAEQVRQVAEQVAQAEEPVEKEPALQALQAVPTGSNPALQVEQVPVVWLQLVH